MAPPHHAPPRPPKILPGQLPGLTGLGCPASPTELSKPIEAGEDVLMPLCTARGSGQEARARHPQCQVKQADQAMANGVRRDAAQSSGAQAASQAGAVAVAVGHAGKLE
ncbi:uncharacterized protein PAN0_018d5580 [Moesziomyces antarcticus]|uniref:Uncharacterized protein n=2 Tax=Pseudozyma antarctica TaxID=84753 RepID=A0A081CL07_PSEA2|nr:uncharacterized protein PAN0_018d5580 [Moesziomyces antarcticus]GAK67353.1 hypothetical protein PAN0_018d5580 [Moesziomyces antarcticus]SPO48601.1 uncharacterized protein PSANT_06292 [Moesziomyces antarcticus]